MAILLANISIFVLYYHPGPKGLAGDETMYLDTAQRIAAGEESHLDPLWPPLYPKFLAWLLVLGDGSLLVIQVAQLAILLLAAALLRSLSGHILGPGSGANLSAFWLLAYPPAIAFAFFLWPEVLHLGLMLAAMWITVVHRRDLAWMPPLGLVLGLAFLTKSLLGPFLPILLAPVLLGTPLKKGLVRLLAVGLAFMATLAPTLIANHQRIGLAIVADSSLFNLWVGLNSQGTQGLQDDTSWQEYRKYSKSGSTFAERNQILREKLENLLQEKNLSTLINSQLRRQYFRLWDHESYLTAQLPGGPLHGPNRGFRAQSGPLTWGIRWISTLAYAFLLAAAAVGMVTLSLRRNPWLWLLLAFLAYNLVLFTFFQVNTRYRFQLLPVLLIYASAWLGQMRNGWRAWLANAAGPRRRVAALMAVALAWTLAFAGPFFGHAQVP